MSEIFENQNLETAETVDTPVVEMDDINIETEETVPASEAPVVEDPVAEAEAPAEEAATPENEQTEQAKPAEQPAPRRRAVRPRLTGASDYMGDAFTLANIGKSVQDELRDIQNIIDHNNRVSKDGRGQYQYLLAMVTGNDEVRKDGDHNNLVATHVYAREIYRNENGTESVGSVNLVFDGADFTAYSNIIRDEDESKAELLRRQHTYTNHAPMSKVQCVPVSITRDENGRASVICSRAFAMERMQETFFFGKHPLAKEGAPAYAYVMSADAHGVRVECMGIETRINRGQLTAMQLVVNAANMYRPGTKIPVIISKLDVDVENRTIKDIQLSGVRYEIENGLVRSVKEFDLAKKPHELAQVIAVSPNFYIVRLTAGGIIGLIPHANVRNGATLNRMDNVIVEINRVDEKTNRFIGSCVKL